MQKPNSKNVVVKFSVTNSGSRTGFLCARVFKDEGLRSKIDGASGAGGGSGAAFHVEPSELVLGVGESQLVTVIWKGAGTAFNASMPVGFLALFHGDEVMRSRLKKIVGDSAMPLAKLPGDQFRRFVVSQFCLKFNLN